MSIVFCAPKPSILAFIRFTVFHPLIVFFFLKIYKGITQDEKIGDFVEGFVSIALENGYGWFQYWLCFHPSLKFRLKIDGPLPEVGEDLNIVSSIHELFYRFFPHVILQRNTLPTFLVFISTAWFGLISRVLYQLIPNLSNLSQRMSWTFSLGTLQMSLFSNVPLFSSSSARYFWISNFSNLQKLCSTTTAYFITRNFSIWCTPREIYFGYSATLHHIDKSLIPFPKVTKATLPPELISTPSNSLITLQQVTWVDVYCVCDVTRLLVSSHSIRILLNWSVFRICACRVAGLYNAVWMWVATPISYSTGRTEEMKSPWRWYYYCTK